MTEFVEKIFNVGDWVIYTNEYLEKVHFLIEKEFIYPIEIISIEYVCTQTDSYTFERKFKAFDRDHSYLINKEIYRLATEAEIKIEKMRNIFIKK
jgi:hypothetical protein